MNYFLLPLKRFAEFKGRSRRKEYWQFFLFVIIIDVAKQLALTSLGSMGIGLSALISIVLFIPSIAVAVRRMHDVNKSGWFILIPIYNLILACTEGTPGPNEYGPDPKRPEFEDFLSEKADPVQPV